LANDRSDSRVLTSNIPTPVVAETLRSTAEPRDSSPPKPEDRMPLFWRVFGGTVLSILALVAVTVYQQFNGALNEIRGDLGHLSQEVRKEMTRISEGQGTLVKAEKYSASNKSIWDAINELRDDRGTLLAVKERLSVTAEGIKVYEEQQKELAREVQQMRELKAAEDERKTLQSEVQRLRERLAALEGKGAPVAGKGVSPAVHHEP
jgi:cell shape-determining protein MreC